MELALCGAGYVAPNPMVGAVLVHDGRIIGEGFHRRYGEAHAEVNCIAHAKQQGNEGLLSRSTMYVSLEPCAHFGKTPPCADLLIRHKIPSVVIGCRDPFPEVDGRGIERLRAAGVEVQVGVLEKECLHLNRRFFTFHQRKRPYIILKWAQTANGMIGGINGQRIWITNDLTNRLVHRWRSEEQGIMVGTNTAWLDDPRLTNRLWHGPSPTRLVIDKRLRLPGHLRLFDGEAKTVILNHQRNETDGHLVYRKMEEGESLGLLLNALYELDILSVIVEGGGQLVKSFINEGLWDEARILRNREMVNEEGVAAPVLRSGRLVERIELGRDEVSLFFS